MEKEMKNQDSKNGQRVVKDISKEFELKHGQDQRVYRIMNRYCQE